MQALAAHVADVTHRRLQAHSLLQGVQKEHRLLKDIGSWHDRRL